jgi:nucleoside-diphosphate-sugar epimerase
VGSAVVNALRSRGHAVVRAARGLPEGRDSLALDFMQPCPPARWRDRLVAARVDAVVNCVGILMASRTQRFERVHRDGPVELFEGAALAGISRVVQVSALGAGDEDTIAAPGGGRAMAERGDGHAMADCDDGHATLAPGDGAAISAPRDTEDERRRAQAAHVRATPYLASKRAADDALAALSLDAAVLRPSLVFGPGSQSATLFATLASLPMISLPGRGRQPVQPIHVFELAEAIVRLLERKAPCRGVYTLGGAQPLDYRTMLAQYRAALGLGDALWLPLPMPLMRLIARVAEWLPQRVYSRDTISMLERGSVPPRNDAARLLGRAPSSLAHGLAITPPVAAVDLRVQLPPLVEWMLRAALAFMWLYTAAVSASLPQESGVLQLLARCGFAGDAGIAALVFSCTLNVLLGLLALRRGGPWAWPLQVGAVLGYTLTAAWNMPELTIDHCGPLAKNLPVLALIVLLWLAQPARLAARNAVGRRPVAVHVLPHASRGEIAGQA